MNGKLIVLDGLDGSGKSTQAELLAKRLEKDYSEVLLISYPDYTKPSSTLVQMYLNGEFSSNADEVNAYASSTFYAVDRFASYMQFWKDAYKRGAVIIASRYVSSNAIHQMPKLPQEEWDAFLAWLSDFEYDKLKLPRPDRIFFLDMPRAVADNLIMSRYDGDESKKDIHEQNRVYLARCQESAIYAAQKENWSIVACSDGEQAYAIEQISDELYRRVKEVLQNKTQE